jgi:hypothetical protein
MWAQLMLRGTSRWIIAIFVAILGALFPVAGIVFAEQDQPEADSAPGQAEPIEREFMTVIRFANLWEIPMGQLAAQRGTTKAVKDTGTTLAADHTALDVDLKKLAAQFNVPLPQTANNIVMKHMTLLEGTGLVSPHSMFAEASARTTAYPENQLSRNAIVMAVVLGLLTLVATLFVIRIVSSGQSTEVRAIMKG